MRQNIFTSNKKSMKITKGVIRIGNSKKDRYSNCQKNKNTEKMTSEDLQNTSQKTKDRATLSPLKPGGNSDNQEG